MSATGQSTVLGKMRRYLEEGQEEDHNTELIPNLPNHITVQLICTKLPWRTFHILSSVSRAWLGAIRGGEISDARVRSRTAETLAVLECIFLDTDPRLCAMALYSLRDKAIYRLPSRPRCENLQSPSLNFRWVTVGGKIFSLQEGTAEVWVLDVAGQKKWQACASMHIRRWDLECAVFEGKIYVFGGYTILPRPYLAEEPIGFSEVYDPKVDAWSKISPMKFWRTRPWGWVGAVGGEIVVDAGEVYQYGYSGGLERNWRPIERSKDGMEAYNPAKDSWRTIPPGEFGKQALQVVGSKRRERLFTAHGRLHSLSPGKISVIDLDKMSVKGLQKCSFKTRSRNNYPPGSFSPNQVLVTNEGLLTKGYFDCPPRLHDKCRLYQSGTIELGFGKKKILLEEVEFSRSVRFFRLSHLEPIQL